MVRVVICPPLEAKLFLLGFPQENKPQKNHPIQNYISPMSPSYVGLHKYPELIPFAARTNLNLRHRSEIQEGYYFKKLSNTSSSPFLQIPVAVNY